MQLFCLMDVETLLKLEELHKLRWIEASMEFTGFCSTHGMTTREVHLLAGMLFANDLRITCSNSESRPICWNDGCFSVVNRLLSASDENDSDWCPWCEPTFTERLLELWNSVTKGMACSMMKESQVDSAEVHFWST